MVLKSGRFRIGVRNDDLLFCVLKMIFRYLSFILLICVFSCQCSEKEVVEMTEQEVATKWADLTLHITKYTPANSPTFASRCLGYIGLTMYESVVHGFLEYQSLEGQLTDLKELTKPEKDENYDWVLALNAGQAEILRSIYIQTADSNKTKIDSLEQVIFDSFSIKINDKKTAKRSVDFGKKIAQDIFEWSKTDGGHRAYLKNFDKSLVHPDFPGSWKPPLFAQSFSHHPLHPHWGKNRTFVAKNAQIPTPKMLEYSTDKASDYYRMFAEVYEKERTLTQAEKEAAIWWSDDPDDTFTPPGHSYYIATIALKTKQASLIKCAETYARVGMAVADAFVECWKWKYHFFSERPNTFIPQHIDNEWVSFWPDPPFPSFPSGHAIQAAAAATVMIDLYGDEFSFTDDTHIGRERDEIRDVDFVARHFDSFWSVALETADSRFYGGIHTHLDNEVGLEEGARIGRYVNELEWRRER